MSDWILIAKQLMAHGEAIDDITDHIHNNSSAAAQHSSHQQPSNTEHGSAAPTLSQTMPAVSNDVVIDEDQNLELPDLDDMYVQHALAGWDGPMPFG